jgi:hypothetical protein
MAYVKGKSGTLDFAGSDNFTLRIKWSETYDLEKNKSILSIDGMQMQSTVYGGTYYPGGPSPDYGTLKVDGVLLRTMNFNGHATHAVSVNAGTSWWDVRAINTGYHDDNEFPWVTGEIEHDADGSKSVTIEPNFNLWRKNAGHYPKITGSQVITLTTIPRASTATVPNFTMGTKGTISISRASSAFTHTLSVKLGSSTYQLATGVSTSYAWTPTIATWAPRITNAASASCTMVIDTYNGSTKLGSSESTFTLSVPASVVPSISEFSVELVNDNAAVNGWGIAVKTFTKFEWSITAAGAQGSTIKTYAFTAGSLKGSAATGTTAAVSAAGNVTPSATATDSRGRTASATGETITVYDYSAPTISRADIFRCTSDGTEDNSGTYLKLNITSKIADVIGKNSATYHYRSKNVAGSFGGWTAFAPGAVVGGFSSDTSYVVEMRVTDAPGKTASTSITIPTREEWLHGRDGGKGAAFGKTAESDNLLDVAWDLRVRGNLILDNPLEGATGVTVVTEAGTNLNDYTKPGWYYFESSYTPTNIPAGSNGWLQVIDTPDHVNSWIKQIWYRSGTPGTNDQQTFVRTKLNNNAWGAWAQYYTNRDITLTYNVYRTLAEIGLSGQVTTQQVFEALPTKSCIIFSNSAGSDSRLSDAPSNYCFVELRRDGNYGYARATQVASTLPVYYFGSFYGAADSSASGFSGWRSINPQMAAGTEYEIAEYHRQKRVYTKVVDCGTLTNGGTYTYHDSTVYPIRYAAYTSAGIALPLFMEPALNSTYKAWVDVNTNKITARFASGYSSLRIYCQVWYTKT